MKPLRLFYFLLFNREARLPKIEENLPCRDSTIVHSLSSPNKAVKMFVQSFSLNPTYLEDIKQEELIFLVRIIDKASVQPRRSFNLANSFIISRSPVRSRLARITIRIPVNSQPNRVDLVATVGVRGVTGIAQILFRIFRDDKEIFNTQQGIESNGSEQNYAVTFQAEDRNVRSGNHVYTVTAENRTANTRADIVGPISFSGLAVKTRT